MRGAGKDPLLELPIAQRDVAVPAAILVRVDAASRVHEQDARAGHPPAELPARGDLAEIGYRDKTLTLPPVADGDIAPTVLARMTALRTGREPDHFRWLSPV